MLLFKGLYPSNYLYFIMFMFTITNFEIIPTEFIYNYFDLFTSDSFNS